MPGSSSVSMYHVTSPRVAHTSPSPSSPTLGPPLSPKCLIVPLRVSVPYSTWTPLSLTLWGALASLSTVCRVFVTYIVLDNCVTSVRLPYDCAPHHRGAQSVLGRGINTKYTYDRSYENFRIKQRWAFWCDVQKSGSEQRARGRTSKIRTRTSPPT